MKKSLFISVIVVVLVFGGIGFSHAATKVQKLTKAQAATSFTAIKKKFPKAGISLEQIQRGVLTEDLVVDVLKLAPSLACSLSRSLLSQRADSVDCEEFKEFLNEIAGSAACSTVEGVLDKIGMEVIGSCTMYFDDNGDPWGECGCGHSDCMVY